jgi:hypothetical protein
MRSRQLKFVFAASPPGGGKSGPSDASVGRDFLLTGLDLLYQGI